MRIHSKDKRREKYDIVGLQPAEFFIVNLLTQKITFYLERYFLNKDSDIKLKLLDLGCGSQPLKKKLISMGFDYYSADVVPIQDVKIDYILNFGEDIKDSEILNQKFDFIVCTEVLEHVPDWNTFFINLNKIASPNAIVLLTSPFIYLLHEQPHDYFRATPFAYEHYASLNNFKIEKIDKAGNFFDVMGTIIGGSGKYVTYRKGVLGVLIKVIIFFLNFIDGIFMSVSKTDLFRKFIRRESAYYLSNIIILRR